MRRLNHQQIVDDYLNGLSQNKIATKNATTQPVISKILRRRGVSKGRPQKYDIINIFEEWNEYSAYILGFCLADGHISKKDDNQRGRRYKLIINLQGDDKQHLENIGNVFCDTLKVKMTETVRNLNGVSKSYQNARLTVYSTDVVASLLNIGWDEFKEGHGWRPFAEVPHSEFRHLSRGFFDGDGGFYLNEKVPCAHIVGHTSFLKWWQKQFNTILGLGGFISERKNKIPCLRYNGRQQVAKIAEYLYSEAQIALPRKKILAFAAKKLYVPEFS